MRKFRINDTCAPSFAIYLSLNFLAMIDSPLLKWKLLNDSAHWKLFLIFGTYASAMCSADRQKVSQIYIGNERRCAIYGDATASAHTAIIIIISSCKKILYLKNTHIYFACGSSQHYTIANTTMCKKKLVPRQRIRKYFFFFLLFLLFIFGRLNFLLTLQKRDTFVWCVCEALESNFLLVFVFIFVSR